MSGLLTIRIALRALLRNRLRTVLTMLGLVIGVGAVITMLAIGNGAKIKMEENIQKMGANAIYVFPGLRKSAKTGEMGVWTPITVEDWEAVLDLPGVLNASPIIEDTQTLVAGGTNWSANVKGVSPSYLAIKNGALASGRIFSNSEINSGSNVIVLGARVSRELFGAADPVGELIRVKNVPFKVIGLFAEKGSAGFRSIDDEAIIPYTTALQRIALTRKLDYLAVQGDNTEDLKQVETLILGVLNDRHGIRDPDDGGFQAFNMGQFQAMIGENTKTFTLLLGGIASVSLLVGGIGVMNIMLVSVTERVREIGIRMALGARGHDILSQFLTESVVLSFLGGALGVGLGMGLSRLIAKFAGWPAVVSEGSILLAFGTSVGIGVFFGFYPAVAASRLDPIEALRHE